VNPPLRGCRRRDRLLSHGLWRQGASHRGGATAEAAGRAALPCALSCLQAIPPYIDRITNIRSDAKFILLVEKARAYRGCR
jgi:hypothetical protein